MLEAVIVVTVMLGSVLFVVSLDEPPTTTRTQRAALEQKVRDALGALHDAPAQSALGSSMLEVAIQECLQGDCSRLTQHLSKSIPTGASYAVYLSTKEGMYPVYAPGSPRAEAVSARLTIEPAWSYQFLGFSQSVYHPLEDPVVLYGLPVFSGEAVQQGSSALRITATGMRPDNAVYVLKGSATTRAVDADASPTPAAASLFFHAGDGAPLAARDATATTLNVLGSPSGAAVPLRLRVLESGGGVVPAGTRVSVHVPQGWTATAQLPANTADWTWIADATNRSGNAERSTVVAVLKRDLTNAHADLALETTYRGHAPDHYTFTASLSAGAYARAQMLVRGDQHATRPAFEVPALLASVPRPLGVGATTTWTLTAFSSDPVTLTRIEVAEEDARAIFGTVVPVSGPGAWTSEGSRLVWTGTAAVSHDAPLALAFRVTSGSAAGPVVERAPFVPSVRLAADHLGRLGEETAPGLYRGVFLPASGGQGGYNASTGNASLRATHEAASAAVYRTTALPGRAPYEVGHVVGLKDSVFGSAVAPEVRTVSPGSTAQLRVDVQSVMYQLATLGLTPSVDVHVYPPWASEPRAPIHSIAVYDGGLAAGALPFLSVIDKNGDLAPEPSNVGRHVVPLEVPRTWLYGPYVVEARVSWLERMTGVVGTTTVTQDFVRSASVYDYIVVAPEASRGGSSALYDVHLVAWFDDWS